MLFPLVSFPDIPEALTDGATKNEALSEAADCLITALGSDSIITEGDVKMARIVVNPRILGGKPIIEGTRISVEFILDLLASDVSEEEILEDYPHLTKEDILACLRYAARSYRNEVYLALEPAT